MLAFEIEIYGPDTVCEISRPNSDRTCVTRDQAFFFLRESKYREGGYDYRLGYMILRHLTNLASVLCYVVICC